MAEVIYPDTFGWDTVFAMKLPVANLALAKLAPSPIYTRQMPLSNQATGTLTWSLEKWEIIGAPGGSDMSISMAFGAASKFEQVGGTSPGSPKLDVAGFACDVTFEAYFPEFSSKLTARTASGVSWAKVTFRHPPGFDASWALIIETILSDWFTNDPEAIELFSSEFMSLDMSDAIGQDHLKWLKPDQLGYAGGTLADGVTQAIGILALTVVGDGSQRRTIPPGARLQLSPYAIPAGASAGFQMSRELVMTNLFKPGVASAFSNDVNPDLTRFTLSEDGSTLTNNVALSYKQAIEAVDRTCTIENGQLSARLGGNRLVLNVSPLTVETSLPGLLVDAQIVENLELSLKAIPGKADAKIFMLENVDAQAPVMNHHYTGTSVISMAVIGALIAIVGLVLMVVSFSGPLARKLTATSAKIISRVIAAAVAGAGLLISTILVIIQAAVPNNLDELPSIDPLLNMAIGRFNWPTGTTVRFAATSGSFANGILMAVEPKFD